VPRRERLPPTGTPIAFRADMLMADDNYIDAIHSYCDRWCETCAFTARCRVFGHCLIHEAESDPNFTAIVNAPPLPQDVPPPPSPEMQALIVEMNDAAQSLTPEDIDAAMPRVDEEHEPLEDRAHGYGMAAWKLMRDLGHDGVHAPADPRAVVNWDALLIPAKVHRAVTGIARAEDDPDDDWPRDCDGSAKVALISIDRSERAWREMVRAGHLGDEAASPFIESLVWLRAELERVFPGARAFVRPGFDEPPGSGGGGPTL